MSSTTRNCADSSKIQKYTSLRNKPDVFWCFRSGRSQMFSKICVLKNFTIFTYKNTCFFFFFFFKADYNTGIFPVNIANFLGTAFLLNTSSSWFWWLSDTERERCHEMDYCKCFLLQMKEQENYKEKNAITKTQIRWVGKRNQVQKAT